MENNGWIKLHRSIVEHELFRDHTAYCVFSWILCRCQYETGTMKSGRFWAAEALELTPSSYYKVLKRLEKKYELISLKSNNKFTTITILNWHKYQSDGNNKVTTKEQQSNTIQEIKKERIIRKGEQPSKEEQVSSPTKTNKFPTFESIDRELIRVVAAKHQVWDSAVRDELPKLKAYVEEKGQKVKMWDRKLDQWIGHALQYGVIKERNWDYQFAQVCQSMGIKV